MNAHAAHKVQLARAATVTVACRPPSGASWRWEGTVRANRISSIVVAQRKQRNDPLGETARDRLAAGAQLDQQARR
jgi:hypothetical protein